ncbi:MAG TPA: hypothetical protein VF746_13330 [Longimicrobium sp.]
MKRAENWDVRLHHWAAGRVGRRFAWGRTDCASLVRQAARVMYGQEVFASVPRWASARQAVEAMRVSGGVRPSLQRLQAWCLPLGFAQSGDVAVGPEQGGEAQTAVVVDGRALVSTRAEGVRLVPLSELSAGVLLWRLPSHE